MRRAASRALAAALLATGVGVLVAGLVLAFVDGSGSTGDALTALAATATMLVGGLVVWTRADHRLGWMFLLAGLLLGLLPAVDAYTAYLDKHDADPIVALVWIAEWWWLPMLFFAFVFWLFLFPDGHLPGPRWRIPFGIALATCAVSTVLAALDPKLDDGDKYSVANPIGVSGLHDIETGASGVALSVLFVSSMLAAAASLVVRFRRSGGVERRQIKWITLGGVAIVLGFLVLGGLNGLGVRLDWAYGALFLIVPVTIGIAILRHRLYDVDLRDPPDARLRRRLGAARRRVRGARACRPGRLLVVRRRLRPRDRRRRRSSSRRCSSRCARGCSGSSTAASTGAATTHSARSRRSERGCASRSSSRAPGRPGTRCRRHDAAGPSALDLRFATSNSVTIP